MYPGPLFGCLCVYVFRRFFDASFKLDWTSPRSRIDSPWCLRYMAPELISAVELDDGDEEDNAVAFRCQDCSIVSQWRRGMLSSFRDDRITSVHAVVHLTINLIHRCLFLSCARLDHLCHAQITSIVTLYSLHPRPSAVCQKVN